MFLYILLALETNRTNRVHIGCNRHKPYVQRLTCLLLGDSINPNQQRLLVIIMPLTGQPKPFLADNQVAPSDVESTAVKTREHRESLRPDRRQPSAANLAFEEQGLSVEGLIDAANKRGGAFSSIKWHVFAD